jgi:outer membrane protein assembly factor BamD
MIEHPVDEYPTRTPRVSGITRFAAFIGLLLIGCAGGIPSIPSSPEAILQKGDAYFARKRYFQAHELYKAFLLRYPGEDRSDYAQFKLAESLYAGEDYALAAVEYHIVVSNYGYSEYVDDGYFKEALCYNHQALKPPLDQTKREDALERLERFITVFPRSPLVPEAQEHIETIREKLAEKAFKNAWFYLKKKRSRSAMIYFDKIIEDYPNNKYWARALFYKGTILVRRGETDEAIRLFSQVIAYPDQVEVKEMARKELARLRDSK